MASILPRVSLSSFHSQLSVGRQKLRNMSQVLFSVSPRRRPGAASDTYRRRRLVSVVEVKGVKDKCMLLFCAEVVAVVARRRGT